MATTDSFLLVGITDGSDRCRWDTAAALLRHGLDFLYLRTPPPDAAPDHLSPAEQASVLLPEAEADRVRPPFRWHLKESDRRRLTPAAPRSFSTSIHDLSDWPRLSGRAELVFYSPVFASISKPGYGPAADLESVARQIRDLRERHSHLPQLVGLGGVSAANVARVRQAGFDGAALMGALWQTPDPPAALRQIQEAVQG